MSDIKKYRYLIVVMIVYYAVFFGTDKIFRLSGSASYILSLCLTLVCALVYSTLYQGQSAKVLWSENTRPDIRMIIGVILLVSALVQSVAVCSYSTKSIAEVFMKKSPFAYILTFVLFPTLFGAYFGIKSVSRYSLVGGIGILFVIALILVFAFEDYSIENMYPLLGKGLPSFSSILLPLSLFSNIIYLYVLHGYKNSQGDIKSETRKIILISGAVFIAISLICSLTVPHEALGHWHDSLLYVASTVDFRFAVERSEALVFVVWIFMSFLTLSSLMTFVCTIAYHTFCLSNRKAIIGALALIVASFSLLIDKYSAAESLMSFSLLWTGAVSIAIPLALRLVSKIRKEQP